ncbi:hypothetical protein YC2023_037378 [Brassica napus]
MAASRRPNWRFTGPLPETVSQSPPSNIPGRDTTTPPLSIVHLVDHQSADAEHNPKKEQSRRQHQRRCYAESETDCSPLIETGATSESKTDQPPSVGASPEYIIPVEIHLIAKKKKRQRGDKETDPTNTNPDRRRVFESPPSPVKKRKSEN